MTLRIAVLTYLEDYRLRLEFSDGTIKEVDLQNDLWGEVFEPLKNLELFRQVRLNADFGTIEWPNGAGFPPEHLHAIGKEMQSHFIKLRRASFKGQGLQPQVAGASWEQVRKLIY